MAPFSTGGNIADEIAMRILRLEIHGYRSLKEQTWSPGRLNVLIGPNASGKSNLLRVLDLLVAAAKGHLAKHIQREGGMEPVVWDGQTDHVQIRAKMSPLPPYVDEEKDSLTYDLTLQRLGSTSAYQIGHELLGNFSRVESGEMPDPFMLLERDAHHAVVFSMDSKRFEARPASVGEDEALLSVASGPFSANRFVAEFQRELANWRIHQAFYTHESAAVRTAQVVRTDTQVDSDGQNLVSVLHSLYTGSREFKSDLDGAMRAAFGDEFEELVFPPAADQRIQLRVRWRSLQREQSAADLSDGTLRFLFLMAVLVNPSPPPLIAIDEPELGLHPRMLHIVAEHAAEAATRTQVILTTHSPEFLDAFRDEPPTTTVVDWRGGETHLRIVSGEELSYWLREYTLGELFRSTELEAMQ